MAEQRIIMKAKANGKLAKLMPLFSSLGYDKVEYKKDVLVIEKLANNLHDESVLDYGLRLKKDSIEFYHFPIEGKKRRVELFQTLMDVLTVLGRSYLIEPT